ncbi:GL14982 [Drosophila persimilis]|uniref:GL14982 n=1 Tax=Drosophila persimilis TaxID=7234 RepID=B4H0F4_DROPE|nr:GL14982 [Drosophila persimilis]
MILTHTVISRSVLQDIQYEFHSNFERDEEELVEDEEEDDDVDVDGDGDDEENDEAEDEDEHIAQDQEHDEVQDHDQDRDYRQQQQQAPSSDLSRDVERHVYGGYTQPQMQQSQPMPVGVGMGVGVGVGVSGRRPHYSSGSPLMRDFDFFLDSASRSSGERDGEQDGLNHNQLLSTGSGSGLGQSVGVGVGPAGGHNYRYSPETTDYDSNCGDLDSLSGEMNGGVSTSCSNYAKYYASAMPVLEDGLSSGHTSDTENNNNKNLQQAGVQGGPGQGQCPNSLSASTSIGGSGGISMLMDMKRLSTNNSLNSMHNLTTASTTDSNGGHGHLVNSPSPSNGLAKQPPPMPQPRELLGQSPSQTQSHSHSQNKVFKNIDPDLDSLYSISVFHRPDTVQMTPPPPAPAPHRKPNSSSAADVDLLQPSSKHTPLASAISSTLQRSSPTTPSGSGGLGSGPGKPRSAGSNGSSNGTGTGTGTGTGNGNGVLGGVPPPIPERSSLMTAQQRSPSPVISSPVWLSRHLDGGVGKGLLESGSDNHSKNHSADEDDVDTDLETDRLLGHQRLDDQGYYDENKSWDRKPRSSLLSKISPKQQMPSTKTRNGYNALLSSTPELLPPPPIPPKSSSGSGGKLLDLVGGMVQRSISRSSSEHSEKSPSKMQLQAQQSGSTVGDPVDVVASAVVAASVASAPPLESPGNGGGSDRSVNGGGGGGIIKLEAENGSLNGGINITAAVAGGAGAGAGSSVANPGAVTTAVNAGSNNSSGSGAGSNSNSGCGSGSGEKKVKKSKSKEGGAVLIEGVLFRAKYLGSTQLVCEGQPTKSTRMMQAEEAVSRIKAPDGDVQPSTEVDLFISTEKIMVLNTDLKEIMMDHALRTISYIADIGDLVVLMARRRFVPQDIDDAPKPNRTPKMICHVFESDEAQFIAQSIGQAFQVAYMEFLKANGIEDHRFVKEMDYQEVLNSQEIFGDELEIFAKKELQKEVVVPKAKGEILGVVIVESGWGSMLPTVVIANLMSSGAAARCGQLNIGDQLIAINGLSLVGLPLSTCQTYIKNTKNQTVVKFTVVPCAPVVEVKIKRPETKYQLGFSVQNGVICSLLRGGIAERGGVRVGHRIIEINNQSVVAVPHEKIVNLLATSVGEILMKTMPTSMFRLLTGQENPIYI